MSPIYVPGKVVLQKQFTQQGYMWEFPAQYGLWSPANITTALWLDAADTSTVTVSSGLVDQWRDKSGNARHASGATATRPAYASTTLNGKNTLTFDGSDDRLVTSAVSLHTGLYSVFAVARAATANTFLVICSQDRSTDNASRNGQYIRTNSATPETVSFNNAGSAFTASATSTVTNWNFYSAIRESTLITLFANGNAGTGAAVTGTAASNANPMTIGSRESTADTFNNHWNGDMAEIIFLGSVATTDTRQRIEGYLAHKWGLTANLPSNHPYKTVGPTP
jgi:hypothetical protein